MKSTECQSKIKVNRIRVSIYVYKDLWHKFLVFCKNKKTFASKEINKFMIRRLKDAKKD